MPRRGSISSRSNEHALERLAGPRKQSRNRLPSTRGRQDPNQTTWTSASVEDSEVETLEALKTDASNEQTIAPSQDRKTQESDIPSPGVAVDHEVPPSSSKLVILPELQGRSFVEPMSTAFAATGFSDDGRSLTPEPHSSEAETEHIVSDAEPDHVRLDYESNHVSRAEDDGESHEELLDVPADLDNLSDSEAHDDTRASVSRSLSPGEVELLEEPVDEQDDSELRAGLDIDSREQTSANSSILEQNDNEHTGIVTEESGKVLDAYHENSFGPPRKRKRSEEKSPPNTKRLAPRKIQAELDSDEEENVQLNNSAIDHAMAASEKAQSAESQEGGTSGQPEAVEQIPIENKTSDETEEVEDDEPEEEVQDDNDREERNRHKQAAMDALRQIEVDFARLRAKLHDERMTQIEREIALAESCEHPLLLKKAEQNSSRHCGRLRRAQVLYESRKVDAEVQFQARKFMAHSQFAQDKQKLRAGLLSKTSAEWFQIHREKRVLDMAVPEYGYVVPERKSLQNKHRRDYEAEVSILAGLKRFVGFPAAPPISVASSKDVETDLTEMGIVAGLGISSRAHHAGAHQHTSSPHTHTSMTAHLTVAQSGHAHAQAQSKAHHHRKGFPGLQERRFNTSDHHTSTVHNHSRHATAHNNATNQQHFHTHAYHSEPASRRVSNSQTTNLATGTNDQDRKPSSHRALQENNNSREFDRDRLQFTGNSATQQIASFHQSGAQASTPHLAQKQAQNLPTILRQDTPEKSKQAYSSSHLSNTSTLANPDAVGSSNGSKVYKGQFWSSKAHESTARPPAPALSSNSAFNATLSQPGATASYIPPKTYSPANQPPTPLASSSKSSSSIPVQPSNNRSYQPPHSFASQSKETLSGASPLYQPRAQQPILGDNKVLFVPGQTPIPRQEVQK